jgi:hypothetical protein
MAKKRPLKKKPAKAAKPARTAARPAAKEAGNGAAAVLFTLRDAGASALRFHSDHEDVARARGVAQALANSPDVADAFVIRNIEIVRRAGP